MFGFGKPKCPVDPVVKDWMEWRLGWLADYFGHERIFEMQVVEPTDKFFPFALTPESAEATFDLVCGYMDLDPRKIQFELFGPDSEEAEDALRDTEQRGRAGYFDNTIYPKVGVFQAELADPVSFVSTVARQLAFVHLLASGRLSKGEEDNDPLAELAAAYFGLGIFGANAALFERRASSSPWSGLASGRKGYMDFPKWGYAHALLAHARAEDKPDWAKHLRPDVRKHFSDSLNYLKKTGDTKFKG